MSALSIDTTSLLSLEGELGRPPALLRKQVGPQKGLPVDTASFLCVTLGLGSYTFRYLEDEPGRARAGLLSQAAGFPAEGRDLRLPLRAS